MSLKCNLCGQNMGCAPSLSKHLREDHDTTEKKYCLGSLLKKDLLTGEEIPYKSLEQYLISDFTGRANLLKWLKSNDKETSKQYLAESLKTYAKLKGLVYFPSHFELRTISSLVSIKTYIRFFGEDVYSVIGEAGLVNRFSIFSDLKPTQTPSVIYEDTREKKPILFNKNIHIEHKKLDYGDYSSGGSLNIERKSLSDLLGTLSSGWTRFQNEMDRAKNEGAYIIVLVDTDINSFLGFNYQHQLHTKASPEFIFKRCRDLCRAYPETLQFLFSGGRRDSAKLIPLLLGWDKLICSRLDLQYYKDLGALDKVCG